MLAGYPETSLTWRALRVLPSVVPGSPVLPACTTLEEAAAGAFGGAPEDLIAAARPHLTHARVDAAIRAARALDAADQGLAVVSGLRSALALFSGGDRGAALAAQQRADAAAKAFGLAFVATRLFPVPAAERLALLSARPIRTPRSSPDIGGADAVTEP